MDTKQIKAIEWMDELERYARDKQISIRILDGIEECKKKMQSENADWREIDLTVDSLLSSIENKTVPSVGKDKEDGQVSIQAVEEQIKRMAQRCQNENQDSVNNIEERKNLITKKVFNDLREITHGRAHLEELKEETKYIRFFENIKQGYMNNAADMFRELLQDISSNYDHMLDHLKSMLQSIGGYKVGIGSEKFYYEYESMREGLNNRMQSKASQSDVGGGEISNFGKRTSEVIKKIVRKLTVKRKIFAWIPLLILLVGLAISALATQKENQETIENAQIEETENDESAAWAVDMAKDVGEKAIKNASLSVVSQVLSAFITFAAALIISLGSVLLTLLLVIILLYIAYLQILRVWCNMQICRQCERYLTNEINDFEHNSALMPAINRAIESAVDEYEQEYLMILNRIFSGTGLDPMSNEQKEIHQFTELREAWNKIKYE